MGEWEKHLIHSSVSVHNLNEKYQTKLAQYSFSFSCKTELKWNEFSFASREQEVGEATMLDYDWKKNTDKRIAEIV